MKYPDWKIDVKAVSIEKRGWQVKFNFPSGKEFFDRQKSGRLKNIVSLRFDRPLATISPL
jgi:hypothetical protein